VGLKYKGENVFDLKMGETTTLALLSPSRGLSHHITHMNHFDVAGSDTLEFRHSVDILIVAATIDNVGFDVKHVWFIIMIFILLMNIFYFFKKGN